MRAPRMLAAILLVASPTFAQAPVKTIETKRRVIAYIGPVPNPAVLIADAHVRVTNRPGLGIVIGVDQFITRDSGDGIMDYVVVLQGADEVEPYAGVAMVQIRRPAEACRPPAGTNLLDPENPWVCPAAPEEVIVTGKGISLAAFVGARSKWVPENAVIPRMVGIITYSGKMVARPLAELDAVEILQP